MSDHKDDLGQALSTAGVVPPTDTERVLALFNKFDEACIGHNNAEIAEAIYVVMKGLVWQTRDNPLLYRYSRGFMAEALRAMAVELEALPEDPRDLEAEVQARVASEGKPS